MSRRSHLIYLAIGFPPAAKSSAYRMRETANQFVAQGWDVTVVTIAQSSWERDFGLDPTLLEGVDPRIEVVELPLVREDLETDIRTYSRERALRPSVWAAEFRQSGWDAFPEPIYGGWRADLEDAVRDLHASKPAQLVLATCVPYVTMAAAHTLWRTAGVPYAVDFRDGWSIDVIGGEEAFAPDSEQGRWERRVLEDALSLWLVNDPIADFYRRRYPDLADRFHVVRNGYDEDSVPAGLHRPDPEAGLVFGHLGVLTSPPELLEALIEAWKLARRRDPLLARSRLEIRGQVGSGARREANTHMTLIREAGPHGVSFGGAAPKADVPRIFAGWDVLVLMIMGGRYMTSGKVYEYAATGLPVMSVHEVEHDATTVMTGHPLWVQPCGFDVSRLADAFCAAAALALSATDEEREAARRHAAQFARAAQLGPAVRALSRLVDPEGDA
ncbi:glycosyltransferase [Nocardioides dongkuii]|uniref:glycosyltransferase n=1 Tax=Nocardioides dongkuii TaxID=2760089 RepID=UPI001C706A86|nr:glycosyltransferase [Nocardioides dongkuii]